MIEKVVIVFKKAGEDFDKVKKTILDISHIFKEIGYNPYSSMIEDESFQEKSKGEMIQKVFNEIDDCDLFVAFVNSEEKSEGMLLEIGYALALKKKFILLIQKDVSNKRLRELATKIIEFDNFNELNNKLKEIK